MINLKSLNIDYLLVNTTNEFLLEYAPIEENSCHKLTGFTGDTGDSLLCPDGKALLFVDGRYHTQADQEVDQNKVHVVKLELGQKQDDAICENIAPGSTIGIVAKKVSQKRLEYLEALLKVIDVKIRLLDNDPFEEVSTSKTTTADILPISLTGLSFSDKIKTLEKPVLLTNSEEISYLCNLRDFSQTNAVKIDGKLLITENGSTLYTNALISANTEFVVKPLKEFEQVKCEKVRVDKTTINAHDFSKITEPVICQSPVKQMKAVKNKAEIEHLKYCFKMTDKALTATREFIMNNDNLSEYDIDKELERNFKLFGAKSLSFKSIVARNQNSALAHYMKSSKDEILKEGDLILIDCGAYYEGGLATDITRVFVKGNPNDEQKRVYTTVLKMFLNAFNYKVTENKTTGFDIDNLTREYLENNKAEGYAFSHGLGHGIGVCVHEAPPNLSKNEIAKTPIKNNMCFTIEPGLYNEKTFGVRLENSCYLENGVIKSFTNMCYEKSLINYDMLTETEKKWLSEFEVK
ncbi:MAG: M24 family metallopeptidase [Cyanobacteria bacterium RUI128]|nr:M24 family metallopeptidase [Cyanobacteria bacterium RUI128]